MHINKIPRMESYVSIVSGTRWYCAYSYTVTYRGHTFVGPDLGALIGRCYEASLGTCSWNEAANPTL